MNLNMNMNLTRIPSAERKPLRTRFEREQTTRMRWYAQTPSNICSETDSRAVARNEGGVSSGAAAGCVVRVPRVDGAAPKWV